MPGTFDEAAVEWIARAMASYRDTADTWRLLSSCQQGEYRRMARVAITELTIPEIERLRGRVATLRKAVARAERQFGFYADLHAKKVPPDTEKSRVNAELANEMRAALRLPQAPEGEA